MVRIYMSCNGAKQRAAHAWEVMLRVNVANNALGELHGSMDSMGQNEGAGSNKGMVSLS